MVEVAVEIFGQGTDVVLLHGMPAHPESMDPIREGLEGSHRVLVPNLHGSGLDPVAALEALEEALEAHGVGRATIIGHSFGTYRAFQLALSGRIEVSKIVAIAPVAYYPPELSAQYDQLGDALEGGAIDIKTLAAMLAPQWFRADYLEAHPEKVQMMERWFEMLGVDGLLDVARVEMGIEDLRPALGDITIPVHMLISEEDAAASPDFAYEFEQILPDGSVDAISGVGHFPQYEAPAETLCVIREMLAR